MPLGTGVRASPSPPGAARSGPSPAALPIRARRAWRTLCAALLAGLAVQYVAGMAANFWFAVPASHPGREASDYFAGVAAVAWWALRGGTGSTSLFRLHVTLGVALGLAALALLGLGIRMRRPGEMWAAAVGLFGVWSAGFNGASFANYGHDFSSMFMAVGWLIAVGAYGAGLVAAR
jgi:hypothetical protein